jgi:hypothetical protein
MLSCQEISQIMCHRPHSNVRSGHNALHDILEGVHSPHQLDGQLLDLHPEPSKTRQGSTAGRTRIYETIGGQNWFYKPTKARGLISRRPPVFHHEFNYPASL